MSASTGKRLTLLAASASLLLTAAMGASAQVTAIDSVVVRERVFNDDPDSILATTSTYPTLISFDDQKLDGDGAGGEFANRHVWEFSADGTNAYQFSNDDFFEVFMDVTLTANPITPRKEAGFLLDTIGGQGQFIVNTDAHEVVAFGNPLPFFAFTADFDSGETIRLGMTYFRDTTDGLRKVIYHAGGVSSPALAFTNTEQGIITGSRFGGYAQFNIAAGNAANFGTAAFGNITIVPGPSAVVTMLFGAALPGLGLAARRLRHR